MPTATPVVSDMLITVKNRQIQQAMYAEMRDDENAARRHFLAAGHLEVVLADEYEQAGDTANARFSRISAGSCLWKGDEVEHARRIFDEVITSDPAAAPEVDRIMKELGAIPHT